MVISDSAKRRRADLESGSSPIGYKFTAPLFVAVWTGVYTRPEYFLCYHTGGAIWHIEFESRLSLNLIQITNERQRLARKTYRPCMRSCFIAFFFFFRNIKLLFLIERQRCCLSALGSSFRVTFGL